MNDPITQTQLSDVEPITLLINPGTATAEKLSELFFEISKLYKMVSGKGIIFSVVDTSNKS